MGFLDKLFGKNKTTHVESRVGNLIEVANNWGIGDGTPLLVDANPDLELIFSDPNPPVPQQLTDKNRTYWEGVDLKTKRNALAVAYLQHPNSAVRKTTIDLVRDVNTVGVTQVLVDLLADVDTSVRKAAAKSIWERQRGDNCKFAVHALRDEIRGHVHDLLGTTTSGLTLGRDNAIRALDLLVEESPDENARKAIQELIDKDVVIEERVKPVDTSSVEYVSKDYKDTGTGQMFTYEVYRAKSKQQALAFLKTKEVHKKLYYIEVETPEGIFGRDIDGMYEI